MNAAFDRRKSLQELEHDEWEEPTYGSNLVKTCHRLRRKPLAEFTAGDLRIMIGQGISLAYLIPLAIERLEEEPLVEGDFFPGDLLAAVLRADDAFWINDTDASQHIRQIVRKAMNFTRSVGGLEYRSIRKAIDDAPRSLTE